MAPRAVGPAALAALLACSGLLDNQVAAQIDRRGLRHHLGRRRNFGGENNAPNISYVDPATAFCYNAFWDDDFNYDTLDQNYDTSIARMSIERPNTKFWCLSTASSLTNDTADDIKTPPTDCKDDGKPADDAKGACAHGSDGTCVRGYDLLLTPPGATCDTPRILYIHGGSWLSGSPWSESYPVHTSKIARETGAVVLSIDFPLIGGWELPSEGEGFKYAGSAASVRDFAVDAWQYLQERGPNNQYCCGLKHAPPMLVAGDSSGGGSAAALLMSLVTWDREGKLGTGPTKLRVPSGGFFESPWLNLASNTGTYYSNNFAASPDQETGFTDPEKGTVVGDIFYNGILSTDANVADPRTQTVAYAINALQYCGCPVSSLAPAVPETCAGGTCGSGTSTASQLQDPIFSPYWADAAWVRTLPPIYLAASASELLAGDSSSFAASAAKAGAHSRSELFYGMWHTFPQWSEGCGGETELWQGVTALKHYGDFARAVYRAYRWCPEKLRQEDSGNVPLTPESPAVNAIHQLAGVGDIAPIVKDDIPPLQLDICGSSKKGWSWLGEQGQEAGEPARKSRSQRRLRAASALRAGGDEADAAALLQAPPVAALGGGGYDGEEDEELLESREL